MAGYPSIASGRVKIVNLAKPAAKVAGNVQNKEGELGGSGLEKTMKVRFMECVNPGGFLQGPHRSRSENRLYD